MRPQRINPASFNTWQIAKSLLLAMLLGFTGCSEKSVYLEELSLGSPYAQLQKALTTHTETSGARISATLLHKALAPYRNDIPEKGLGVLFNIEGRGLSWFAPKDMIYTIEDGQGRRVILSGLGTDHFSAKGESGKPVLGVGFVPLSKLDRPLAGEVVNTFIIIVPLELNANLFYLRVIGENYKNPDYRFKLGWKFR